MAHSLASSAEAATFDERGRLVLESPRSFSLDSPEEISFGSRAAVASDFLEDAEGLEGRGALIVTAASTSGAVALLDSLQIGGLLGRRIEAKVWMKPQGIELQPFIYFSKWTNVPFYPTGRATSDGWREMSTGPFDARFGNLLPRAVFFRHDLSFLADSSGQLIENASEARALIDAFELVDLGPAIVPGVACDLVNERTQCGEHGACFAARCVDAKHLASAPEPGPIRDDYIARRLGELERFHGVRATRDRLGAARAIVEAAADEPAPLFWEAFTEALDLLVDGHGGAPSTSRIPLSLPNGVCLGPGLGDQLPGDTSEMRPMVFRADDSALAAALEPGDVLTHLDGVEVWTWFEAAKPYLYYNGDPAGRRSVGTLRILHAAQRTGALARFARCPLTDRACAPDEVTTIEVDFAQIFRPVLDGQDPASYDRLTEPPCDMRFEQILEAPATDRTAWAYFAGSVERDGVREIVINNSSGSGGDRVLGPAWTAAITDALADTPERVLLDQRYGSGGSSLGVSELVTQFIKLGNPVSVLLLPWLGGEASAEMRRAFADCTRMNIGICGQSQYERYGADATASRNGASARLAVVNGYDISGNDYIPRLLAEREAPTRFFGYGPTMGAYGGSCSFPAHIGEPIPMRYQCTDTILFPQGSVSQEPVRYESATGVAPDELVYQRQSDAANGVDTLLEAARAWLLEDATTTGGTR